MFEASGGFLGVSWGIPETFWESLRVSWGSLGNPGGHPRGGGPGGRVAFPYLVFSLGSAQLLHKLSALSRSSKGKRRALSPKRAVRTRQLARSVFSMALRSLTAREKTWGGSVRFFPPVALGRFTAEGKRWALRPKRTIRTRQIARSAFFLWP